MERAKQQSNQLTEHPAIKPSSQERLGNERINPDLEESVNRTREKIIAELEIKLDP